MLLLAYYSSSTGNTHAFVERLQLPAFRIDRTEPAKHIDDDYILVLPTYADGEGNGAVPKAVIHFLNEKENRHRIRGVIAGGNRNFGNTYALAGDIIAQKCNVPCLYRFELRGTQEDADNVHEILKNFKNLGKNQC